MVAKKNRTGRGAMRIMRRSLLFGRLLGMALSASLVFALGGTPRAQGEANVLSVGIISPLTGASAEDAELLKDGAVLAIEEQNAKGGIAGYRIEGIILNDASATTGDFDPALAATLTKKLIANSNVVGIVGPKNSGSGKAMSAILSEADLATITGSATNPDITDPKFATQFRPKGRAVFFRTVSTDAYQAPEAANFFAEKLHVTSAYIVDDGGAFGVGVANAFEKRAAEKGIKILGREQINPKEADYTTLLTKIKSSGPELLYYTGDQQAGSNLAKQAYTIIPKLIKGGTDALLGGSFLKGAAFPSVEGWYTTVAAPHLLDNPEVQPWVSRFVKRWGKQPFDYSICTYDAALVIFDAISRVVKSGKPVNRHTVRDAIQTTHLKTMQGVISFDTNGDLVNKVITVFQVVHNAKYPDDDSLHQFKYVGVAPEN
ncbi:MAG: branched-chain amino acid ABC transporter substrate-binding protein [Bacillati bacterium ANGP1]|uniref:Branched-chain amino acid ABC transporter substrate-binding protein n=1 Tax=Candidatus Segetimicrobium genomatis TaxID=2569760 RepID=A0A537JII9_9BACT|nr:MAG: branched-chain amino acid ABC transporter substrate-binding protein [Terrabacteria group bacterium ANGP1]